MGLLGDIDDFGKGVIDDKVKWTERAMQVGEFIVRNTAGAQLDQVAKVGGQLIDLSQRAGEFFESKVGRRLISAAQSPILVAGQQTIELMKQSTGTGEPENGQRFNEGAGKLDAVAQALASAFPDDSWNSSGACAYTGSNAEQVGHVNTMLGLDNMVAGVLSTEAGQVSAARASLDGHSDWLGASSMFSTTAGIVPGFGKAAQLTAEFAMVAKAVSDSTDDLNVLQGHIDENAAVVQAAATQYETLARGVTPTGADFAAPAGECPTASAAPAPGGPAGGDGGGLPPGGGDGGGTPSLSGGEEGGTPSAAAAPASAPGLPPSAPGAGSTSSDAAGSVAGALGGILGSLMSPLSGMVGGVLGGVMQAANQAAQMASQAVGQGGGIGADTAQLDKVAGDSASDDDADRDDEKRDGDEKDKARDETDDEAQDGQAQDGQVGGPSSSDSSGAQTDSMGAGPGGEPAKTLPPDLEGVALGGGAAGQAPVHVGADFEQGQLPGAATATLDRGVPGSAAVIDSKNPGTGIEGNIHGG